MFDFSSRTAVIVDEHPLWLVELRCLLEEFGVVVVAQSRNTRDGVAAVLQHAPDIVIADSASALGDRSEGGGLLAWALRANPEARCIVLAESDSPAARQRAFRDGAAAFCVRSAEPEDLMAAVRQSFEHSVYFPPRTTRLRVATTPMPRSEGGSVPV